MPKPSNKKGMGLSLIDISEGGTKSANRKRRFSFGWESEWVAAERSRMEKEGETGQRKSFLDHCMGDLARYKENKRKGVEPTNPDEDREAAKRKEQKAERAKAEEEKRNLLFGDFFTDRYVPVHEGGKEKIMVTGA